MKPIVWIKGLIAECVIMSIYRVGQLHAKITKLNYNPVKNFFKTIFK